MAHTTIYGVPFFRVQGGQNAVIVDPVAGDIGFALFADRDLSSVKATGAAANPGSARRFDMADGMYFGGLLNGTPVQYLQFTSSGINAVSPSKITCTAPNIELDASTQCKVVSPDIELVGNTKVTGNLQITGTTTGNGVNLNTHEHSGVQTGSGNSGPPI
jgi:phage baseplate assembly protein gpV